MFHFQYWWYIFPWIFGQIYLIIVQILFNIIGNIYWFFKRIHKLPKILKKMKEVSSSIKTIQDVINQYREAKYRYDGLYDAAVYKEDGTINWSTVGKSLWTKFPTWVPTSYIFFAEAEYYGQWFKKKLKPEDQEKVREWEYGNNCDGFDPWARWLIKCLNKNWRKLIYPNFFKRLWHTFIGTKLYSTHRRIWMGLENFQSMFWNNHFFTHVICIKDGVSYIFSSGYVGPETPKEHADAYCNYKYIWLR